MLAYQIAVLIHILAVAVWVGGSLFLVLVLLPMTRRDFERPEEGARLLGQVARKFRPVAWTSIVLLVLTGLYIAGDHWQLTPGEFFTRTDWFARVLQIKVGLVAVIILISSAHDFVIGPQVSNRLENPQTHADSGASLRRARRTVVWIARINLLLILTVVVLAVTLTRGAPI